MTLIERGGCGGGREGKMDGWNAKFKILCFPCNIAVTNFLVSNTCEIRFHDVIGQSTVFMYFYAKILKHGSKNSK